MCVCVCDRNRETSVDNLTSIRCFVYSFHNLLSLYILVADGNIPNIRKTTTCLVLDQVSYDLLIQVSIYCTLVVSKKSVVPKVLMTKPGNSEAVVSTHLGVRMGKSGLSEYE